MKDHDREESRKLLLKLVGMTLTETFYDGDEVVLEFDKSYRLQLSPKGLVISTRRGAPDLETLL